MRPTTAFPLLLAIALASGSPANAAVKVVTTTQDLASLVSEVGGADVQVDAIARGYQDPHFVEAKPSFILKLHRTDLLVAVGRELEIGWLPALVRQCRNNAIQPGAAGYLDASLTAQVLDIPTGQVTRAMGDVHPQGNPHYWLDPENGRRMAAAIRDKLSELDPSHASDFARRFSDFDARLAEAERRWEARLAPFRGTQVVTYHRSWPNFCERFGLDVIDYVEPRPGIPPSPAHVLKLIGAIKEAQVRLLLVEPYFDLKTPEAIARETGAQVVVLAPSVGGAKGVDDYFALFDYNIGLVLDALGAASH
jgi:ABC-type Zn uptake system ZnuABC Zn-binding protein ZnuA